MEYLTSSPPPFIFCVSETLLSMETGKSSFISKAEKNISQIPLQSHIFHISELQHSSLFANLFSRRLDMFLLLLLCHWMLLPHLLPALAVPPHPRLQQLAGAAKIRL